MNFLLNPQIRRIFCLMAYHFDRSDVATAGLFNFFKQASLEERHHAELIMEYMNKRGGQIILSSVPEPKASYVSIKEALIDALNMEKEVNECYIANGFKVKDTLRILKNTYGDYLSDANENREIVQDLSSSN
uniref:Ferritin n=1 Tax=Glossina austeni TaxID=7395 RepID=A0A1A9VC32_GLOAU